MIRSPGTGRAAAPGASWAAAALAALWLAPHPATAQSDTATAPRAAAVAPAQVAPASIRYGKWAAAALAVGATAIGIHQHNAGNSAFGALVQYCGEITTCTIAPDGRYADPKAEATYQQVVRDDRSARLWLVVGQVSAVGAAVLFVLELRNAAGPPNIPFAGLLVEPSLRQTKVGFRVGVGW